MSIAAVMSLKRTILLAMVTSGILLTANSQEDINFTSLTIKDGLSSNTVTSILRDNYGFMWFGTEDGLNKFDGTNFKVYRYRPNDSTSLQTNEILSLHEDKKGNLWIGTSGGSLSLYDRKKDAFINFPARETPGYILNNVIMDVCADFQGKIWVAHYDGVNIVDANTRRASDIPLANNAATGLKAHANCLYEDSKQIMWIGTASGLFQYNPVTKSLTQFLHNNQDSSSLSGNDVRAVVEDHDGNTWIGTDGGLSVRKKGTKQFSNYFADKEIPGGLRGKSVNALAVDGEKLWIATQNSLEILDIKSGLIQSHHADGRNVHSLTARFLRRIYVDGHGTCWLATHGGGVNKYDKNLNLFGFVKTNVFDQKGLNAPVIRSFEEDENGNVFVGTEAGTGISLFDRKTKLFQHYTLQTLRKTSDKNITVLTLKKRKKDQLLVGTFGDGLFVFNPLTGNYRQMMQGSGIHDLNSNLISCLKTDRAGNLWVGTNGEGLNILNQDYKVIARYTPIPKLPNDRLLPLNAYIRDIVEDINGNIWIATHGGGMAVFNPAVGKFTIYNTRNSALPNDKVLTLHEDGQGNIWAGTFGNGVAVLNPKTNKFTFFSETNGLQNNTIYKIVEDKKGVMWVSTNKAISSIDINTQKINNYSSHNGVQNNNFVGGAGLVLSSGEIFFGGLEGFNYLNPAYLKRTTNVPAVLMTDLRISNQSVIPSANGPIKENISIAKEIDLDYKQNFALSFVGLNYTSPEQNRYAYKLEGFDKDWNYVGHTTTASYTNLDPGSYVFRVKASNSDGIWNNEGASIKIYVHPPFWRTTFAYILYACVVISLVLYLRYRSIRKWRNKFRIEQEQKEAERVHELDRLKIKFLTNLSHEFRTPISLILGPVDTLLSQQNEKTHSQLHMVKRNAKRLLNLVNQLLDFRKMEEQELTLHESEGELVSFIKEASDSFKDLSEKNKINFAFHSDIDRLHTHFDHDKIERIIFNLLSNAFKFTLKGGKVSLQLQRMSHPPDLSGNWITIKIIDSGIGIPEDKKEKIFERFFQHATAASILNQGTGIGLSITKEFVQMHGGTIDVQSECGKGTAFSVHLPFIPVTANNNENQLLDESDINKETPNGAFAEKPNGVHLVNDNGEIPLILLVEDNEDFRLYLKDNLRLHYKVDEASDGREGWQKALSHHPQLIVSDISMPHMNGIELTNKLKSDKRTNHIPVILLTALTGEKEQIKGLETGANDYVTKPFNFEVLNAKIHNLLALNNTLKNTYTKQLKVLSPEIKIESDDEKLLNTIMIYLEENLTNSQLSVEDLSKHVGMSRSSLYNKILELTGKTPVEFIRAVKLDKAAVLLEKSDMNVAQIAYSTGFSTPHYFTKSFKAKFEMLPSEFMVKMRKKNGNGKS
jgi:signal transduction histidine kinase/ligand-binding sensor domain-containing protein/DNA-binding response OmpR family regulator